MQLDIVSPDVSCSCDPGVPVYYTIEMNRIEEKSRIDDGQR